jgi:formylmethanofuran dehydrogenase subunit C
MPQENLNKIYNAGKYFEPKLEQDPKPSPAENKPSNVKRKISVVKAFMPEQEDPFKQKVEKVLEGVEEIEPESEDSGFFETIVGNKQSKVGSKLSIGQKIHVKGNVGDETGWRMSGGMIFVEGNARHWTGNNMHSGTIHVTGAAERGTGSLMSGGILRIDGDIVSFDKTAFWPQNKGTIIWKKEIIWENGEKIEPAWSKLHVEDKIAD